MKKLLILFFLFINLVNAQDVKIGAPENRFNQAGGFYDYSDPRYVNIMVNIWGYVRFPGKYYVPEQSKLIDLVSYAGGPTPDAFLDDIRLYRVDENGKTIFQKYDIDQLMHGKINEASLEDIPKLKAGDIVLIPGEPKLYLRDYVSIVTSLISVSISLVILILNIVNRG